MRRAIHDAVTPDDVRALFGKLLQRALEGDTDAAKVVLVYTVGRPQPAISDPVIAAQERDDELSDRLRALEVSVFRGLDALPA
jgi:hypothetical protein